MSAVAPLNGTRTHALSDHAQDCLALLCRYDLPRQNLNPGVINRLLRENLIEIVSLPSPFAGQKGKPIDHARITEAGRARPTGEPQ